MHFKAPRQVLRHPKATPHAGDQLSAKGDGACDDRPALRIELILSPFGFREYVHERHELVSQQIGHGRQHQRQCRVLRSAQFLGQPLKRKKQLRSDTAVRHERSCTPCKSAHVPAE